MKTLEKRFVDYFDKVFLLTMANRKDRKNSVFKQLKEIGIYDELINSGKFEVVETVKLPITQNALDHMAKSGDISFTYANEQQHVGQFMCASEHYKMVKRSLINGYERILILEDDVCFFKDFSKIMEALDRAPEDFKILHLEGYYWPCEKEDKARYVSFLTPNVDDGYWISTDNDFRLYCTAALIYSREGMREYCEIQENFFQSPDHPTFWMGNSYSYSYPLIMQEKKSIFQSDIIGSYGTLDIEDINVYLTYYDYNNYYHFFEKQHEGEN